VHNLVIRVATTDALLDLNTIEGDRASERCIEALAWGLAKTNLEFLTFYKLPTLYRSGVRYYHNPRSKVDDWADAITAYQRGYANCAAATPWRLAELWMMGVNARPVATIQRLSVTHIQWHLYVGLDGANTEDPSRIIGMKS